MVRLVSTATLPVAALSLKTMYLLQIIIMMIMMTMVMMMMTVMIKCKLLIWQVLRGHGSGALLHHCGLENESKNNIVHRQALHYILSPLEDLVMFPNPLYSQVIQGTWLIFGQVLWQNFSIFHMNSCHHHQEWGKFFWPHLGGMRDPLESIAAV